MKPGIGIIVWLHNNGLACCIRSLSVGKTLEEGAVNAFPRESVFGLLVAVRRGARAQLLHAVQRIGHQSPFPIRFRQRTLFASSISCGVDVVPAWTPLSACQPLRARPTGSFRLLRDLLPPLFPPPTLGIDLSFQ